ALNVNESDVIFHSIMVHYENDLPVQIEDRCVNADIAVDYLTQRIDYVKKVSCAEEANNVYNCIVDASISNMKQTKPVKLVKSDG
ncbi:UTRA domain-containing protein, partial [Salmonella enterica subsp. enterica serovar Virginia]|nr:UTRA domain-containing protein [Salmonella enterica subsp. enterica serovar Virginia]